MSFYFVHKNNFHIKTFTSLFFLKGNYSYLRRAVGFCDQNSRRGHLLHILGKKKRHIGQYEIVLLDKFGPVRHKNCNNFVMSKLPDMLNCGKTSYSHMSFTFTLWLHKHEQHIRVGLVLEMFESN